MTEPSTVVLQARVPRDLADDIARDVETLGLDGTSDAIRQGLRLLHRKAQEHAMARSYDDFYKGERAPVSEATAALYADIDLSDDE